MHTSFAVTLTQRSTLKLNHLPSNGNWTPSTTSIMKSSGFCHPFAFKRHMVAIGRTKKRPSVYFRASNTWRGNLVSGSVATAINSATTDAGVPLVSSSSLPSTLKRPSKSAYPQVYRPSSSLYLRCAAIACSTLNRADAPDSTCATHDNSASIHSSSWYTVTH